MSAGINWSTLLNQLDEPAVGEVAEALASAQDIDVSLAYDRVERALEGGDLIEDTDAGLFGVVRAPNQGEDEQPIKEGESNPEERQKEPSNPTPKPDRDRAKRAKAAFSDAIEFYHQKLDTQLPVEYADTAREYFEEVRGWSPETISEKKLGYAPADAKDELIAYLHQRGHDRDAIQASGLFYEDDLYPHFNGRFVLPYFDESGEPVYAISRSIDEDNGGHPGDHHGEQKYTKAIKGKDYSEIDEPIYGLSSIDEDTEELLVAGGIADAITLHEAGYACISPVTTVRFKRKHEERVIDLVDEYDIGGVYMINDAERPTVDAQETEEDTHDGIGDVLTIQGWGEGLRAAFGNADFLIEEDIDTYLIDLPAGDDDLDKLDPDDYIKEGWGSIETLVASAKPAQEHTDYQKWCDTRRQRSVQSLQDDSPTPTNSDGDGSALFDLRFSDVSGMSTGDRGVNPLGHHGNSENYFVVTEEGGDVYGYDHKYGVAYNALTYLACDAGIRRASDPTGRFTGEEILKTWVRAKEVGAIPDDDPIPYRALREAAVTGGLVERDALISRYSTTGEVVEDTSNHEGDTYLALPPGTYNDALAHIEEEYGVDPGRESAEYDNSTEEYRRDPREVEATVDPRRAWDAAGRVTPADLETEELPATEDGEAFAAPDGRPIDVVRAVAISEGLLETHDEPLDDAYPEAYRLARESYDAPLPEYYTTADAIAKFDAVLDVIGEVTFFDLDVDALNSEITKEDDEVDGEAVRAINPSWRFSESRESVLVFESGTIWDADTERVIDPLRFVALDTGRIPSPSEPVEGEAFTASYHDLRKKYGAPLPRWDPAHDGERDITPQLPPSEELVDGGDLDGVDPDALEEARREVEGLIGDAVTKPDSPTVVTALPATGKTTGTVKTARDRPLSYLAPRKELQAQALEKADRWGVDALILPVFSEEQIRDEVLAAAVSHVREHGKSRLRDRWAVLAAAFDDLEEEDGETPELGDIFVEDDDTEEVDLDRPTCETADGEHGVAWALAVHVARRLGYTPQEIHTEAVGLFGAPLPCTRESDCRYSNGWDAVGDADNPADLLVGSYVHAHVESVRTKYDRGPDGRREKHPRAVVLDEFPGEAYTREFGPEALDFATWLATCLREDVADRRDMVDADLYGDGWVRSWLDGDVDDAEAAETIDVLARVGELFDARKAAEEILDEVDAGLLKDLELAGPLSQLVDGEEPVGVFRDLRATIDATDRNRPAYGLVRWADEAVADPLAKATVEGAAAPSVDSIDTEAIPFGGDLEAIIRAAVEAVEEGSDTAREALAAATTALRGGREGCRRLAAWADDGYAHPDAHHILRGVITPTSAESADPGARRIHTDAWAFDPDATDGTVLDVVKTSERARTVVDRNDHGALLHNPPSRKAGSGDEVAFVGLDATGRAELWENALGEEPTVEDIHETPSERAEFLLEALDLRVIQAADRPRPYEGDPTTKDTDGDVALLQSIAEEYAGIEAPRERGGEAVSIGKPAAITTKGVRNILEKDPRLDGVVAAWENYGNVTGANDLGKHRLAAILGSQHYGDHAIERFCALAGREVDTSRDGGRGKALEYGDPLADAYLAHMREDQTMQAILRFARGDSGATVVARTSALREDLPVEGDAQVVQTWSETATAIAKEYRRLGDRFTVADVADAVDVTKRQVRRVLGELVDAGYVSRVSSGDGVASTYERAADPTAGEVELPERGEVVATNGYPGRSPHNQYYTWNVRVKGGDPPGDPPREGPATHNAHAPPAPRASIGAEPPG